MGADHNLFYLRWGDGVAQDVAHVGGIPIEPFDFFHPLLSIYASRIYRKREGGLCALREVVADPEIEKVFPALQRVIVTIRTTDRCEFTRQLDSSKEVRLLKEQREAEPC